MTEPVSKLNYRIVNRRPLTVKRIPGANAGWQAGPTSFGAMMQPDVDMDQVDVEWTHTDGFPPDTVEHCVRLDDARLAVAVVLDQAVTDGVISVTLMRTIMTEVFPKVVRNGAPVHDGKGIITVPNGTREVIKDQLNVPSGSSTAAVQMLLEEKRHVLAKALKVEL